MNDLSKPTASDITYSTIKGGVSCIPLIGALLSEYFSLFISSPLEKRQQRWINFLEKRLSLLEEKINIQSLSDNEEFITLLLKTSRTAINNHQQEKLEYLANALVNSTLFINEIEEDKKLLFIDFIEELTVSHIILLDFIDNPSKFIEYESLINLSKTEFVFLDDNLLAVVDTNNNNESGSQEVKTIDLLKNKLINKIFPNYQPNNEEFYKNLLRNLVSKNLVNPSYINRIHFIIDNEDKLSGSTKLGKEFVYFITEHINY